MTPIASLMARIAAATLLLIVLPAATSAHANPTTPGVQTGVLVVTPDRGFLGNQETRDAFDAFAKNRNAALVYITDKRSEAIMDARLRQLRDHGAQRIVALPLVVSTSDSRWKLAEGWLHLRKDQGMPLAIARPYGSSYLAVEDLSARLRAAHTDKHRLLLLGYGAADPAAAARMRRELLHMGGFASTLAPNAIEAVVYPTRKAGDTDAMRKHVTETLRAARDTLVVPVAFAPRDDSMMAFSHWFSRDLPGDSQMLASPIATTDALAQWMQRATIEADMQFAPLDASQVGMVVLAHGADWFWNQDIEQALAPVAARHKVAFAFSMGDAPTVERAVRQLEKEHVHAIVVVRAYGMASSFLPAVDRMLGIDVENATVAHAAPVHAMHGDGHGMHHGGDATSIGAAPRIRSALPMVTVGGVNDDPLFAKALLANARSVSRDPARETVIVVAHGKGDDAGNQQWLDTLDSLTRQMRADGGDAFRAIRYATWREDWPDKRKAAVAHVRQMVEQADRDGRALIVPARINERGAADKYLAGFEFGWGRGFAQTPYFAQWVEQEFERGVAKLRPDTGIAGTPGNHASAGNH